MLTACLFGSFFSACFLIPANTKHFEPCYGIPQQARLAVHLVETASETSGVYVVVNPDGKLPVGIASCEGFDGVAAGGTYTFADFDLAERVLGHQCSLPVADIDIDGVGTISTARGPDAANSYSARGGGALELGATTVSVSTTISGCSGQWIFGTFPYGIARLHTNSQENDLWADDYLFDQLSPGSDAPVVIMRYFRVDEGTTCSALPPSVVECADLFSGYYERAL
jgi:hypothetical protein